MDDDKKAEFYHEQRINDEKALGNPSSGTVENAVELQKIYSKLSPDRLKALGMAPNQATEALRNRPGMSKTGPGETINPNQQADVPNTGSAAPVFPGRTNGPLDAMGITGPQGMDRADMMTNAAMAVDPATLFSGMEGAGVAPGIIAAIKAAKGNVAEGLSMAAKAMNMPLADVAKSFGKAVIAHAKNLTSGLKDMAGNVTEEIRRTIESDLGMAEHAPKPTGKQLESGQTAHTTTSKAQKTKGGKMQTVNPKIAGKPAKLAAQQGKKATEPAAKKPVQGPQKPASTGPTVKSAAGKSGLPKAGTKEPLKGTSKPKPRPTTPPPPSDMTEMTQKRAREIVASHPKAPTKPQPKAPSPATPPKKATPTPSTRNTPKESPAAKANREREEAVAALRKKNQSAAEKMKAERATKAAKKTKPNQPTAQKAVAVGRAKVAATTNKGEMSTMKFKTLAHEPGDEIPTQVHKLAQRKGITVQQAAQEMIDRVKKGKP